MKHLTVIVTLIAYHFVLFMVSFKTGVLMHDCNLSPWCILHNRLIQNSLCFYVAFSPILLSLLLLFWKKHLTLPSYLWKFIAPKWWIYFQKPWTNIQVRLLCHSYSDRAALFSFFNLSSVLFFLVFSQLGFTLKVRVLAEHIHRCRERQLRRVYWC